MQRQTFGISWQISDRHGWGIFGLNLALNLLRNGPCPPLLFTEPNFIGIPDELSDRLRAHMFDPARMPDALDHTVLLHSLGNAFIENKMTRHLRGRANVAFAFYEEAFFDDSAITRANAWDRLLVGSSWNRDSCLQHGITDVAFVSQGIDTNHFYPGPKQGVPSGRFVIYSGGKLEYRKGQDLVLAAFKQFNARHPDSLLVTAWQNRWVESARTIVRSPLIATVPEQQADGQLNMAQWAVENGVPENAFIDLGWISNARLPAILRETDLALLPSRCEGGTNLVAMETMACGIPCILSANTGHLDIIDGESNCYPLTEQHPCGDGPTAHWRESQIEEMVARLEQAYTDTQDRRSRSAAGAQFMKSLSWEIQTKKLVDHIHPFLHDAPYPPIFS